MRLSKRFLVTVAMLAVGYGSVAGAGETLDAVRARGFVKAA
ncbi:MAG: hypothetical protein Kow0092_30570 [Deferrisomatales bacterium]